MWRPLLLTTALLVSSSFVWQVVEAEKGHSSTSSSSSSSPFHNTRELSSSSSSCNLPCENGGVCKMQQSPEVLYPPASLVQSNSSSSSNLQPVCDCSNTDYSGEFCDVHIQPCPLSSSVVCLYGQMCVQDSSGSVFCVCDPSATNADGSSACQHHRTQVCAIPGQPPGRSGSYYCVNDGVCDGQG